MIVKEWRVVDDWDGFVILCEFKIGKRRGACARKISQGAWNSSYGPSLLRDRIQSVSWDADEFIKRNT